MSVGLLRIGLAGTQYMGRLYVRSAREAGAEVVAVASPNTAREFAERHGVPAHYKDYRSMIEDAGLDAVVIAAPNDLHYDICLAAADAGKHVLCEKPLALSLEEADAMVAACARAGVLLMYGENLLFAPMFERVRELAARGDVGEPFMVKQSHGHEGPHSAWFWDIDRAGGGALMDMGPHSIHTVCHAMGAWPEAVTANLGRHLHAERTLGEDHATLLLHFPGGRLGVAEASWAIPGGVSRLDVYGPHGRLTADLQRGAVVSEYRAAEGGGAGAWSDATYESAWQYGFPQELRHFVDAIRGQAPLRSSGEDGRRVLEIISAAYASARLGQRVGLPFESDREKAIDNWLDEPGTDWEEWA